MSLHHSFDIKFAAIYGVEEAILIHHFQHWILINKRMGKNNIEGKTWSYQSQKWISAHFPYWKNRDKVRRIVSSLVKQKVLVIGNFNKSSYDRTIWYAFNDEVNFLGDFEVDKTLQELSDPVEQELSDPVEQELSDPVESAQWNVQNCTMERADPHNGVDQNAQPIPDTITYTKDSRVSKYIAQSPKNDEIAQSLAPLGREQRLDFSFSSSDGKFIGITPDDLYAWKTSYPDIDVPKELIKSEQWILANPSKSKKKLWRKFVVGWLTRASDKAENQKAYRSQSSSGSSVDRRTKNADGTPVVSAVSGLF